MEEFRGFEEVVFVILLDDAKLFRIVQRAEMDGGWVYGGGDVHEFQAKRAARKRELANIAHQGDVGVIDGDVQLALIVQAGGLVAGPCAAGFFFLRAKRLVGVRCGIKKRGAAREKG